MVFVIGSNRQKSDGGQIWAVGWMGQHSITQFRKWLLVFANLVCSLALSCKRRTNILHFLTFFMHLWILCRVATYAPKFVIPVSVILTKVTPSMSQKTVPSLTLLRKLSWTSCVVKSCDWFHSLNCSFVSGWKWWIHVSFPVDIRKSNTYKSRIEPPTWQQFISSRVLVSAVVEQTVNRLLIIQGAELSHSHFLTDSKL
jgi:hypothetical protein